MVFSLALDIMLGLVLGLVLSLVLDLVIPMHLRDRLNHILFQGARNKCELALLRQGTPGSYELGGVFILSRHFGVTRRSCMAVPS